MIHTEEELAEVDGIVRRLHRELKARSTAAAVANAKILMDALAFPGWWDHEAEYPPWDRSMFLQSVPAAFEIELNLVARACQQFRANTKTMANLLKTKCAEYLAIRPVNHSRKGIGGAARKWVELEQLLEERDKTTPKPAYKEIASTFNRRFAGRNGHVRVDAKKVRQVDGNRRRRLGVSNETTSR